MVTGCLYPARSYRGSVCASTYQMAETERSPPFHSWKLGTKILYVFKNETLNILNYVLRISHEMSLLSLLVGCILFGMLLESSIPFRTLGETLKVSLAAEGCLTHVVWSEIQASGLLS